MSNRKSKGTKAPPPSAGSPQNPERPAGYDALPKRFRDYIGRFEQQLHALQAVLDAEGETRVRLEYYGDRNAARHLPNDARIVFYLEGARERHGGTKVEVRLDERRGSKGISISSPDGRVIVLPEVSNEVCVKVGDY